MESELTAAGTAPALNRIPYYSPVGEPELQYNFRKNYLILQQILNLIFQSNSSSKN
jgi:hypothetical protein